MGNKTDEQYRQAFEECRQIFIHKIKDYGASWRILRPSSLTDQIFIKAQRIRNIEEGKEARISDTVEDEFKGILNYAVIALIQLELGYSFDENINPDEVESQYGEQQLKITHLMENKNHDYGEAWRDMRISSFTDMILMRILRMKKIEENKGNTLISEGIDSHYMDIANYALFALIKLKEKQNA